MADIMKYIDAIFNFVLGILGIFEQDDASETVAKIKGQIDAVGTVADQFIGEIEA